MQIPAMSEHEEAMSSMTRLEASPGSRPLPRRTGRMHPEIGKPRTYPVEPLSHPAPQMKPAEILSQQPQEPPTVVPERASAP
jgi:hypothetical protein